MNAYKELEFGIKWVLYTCTSYEVAKELGIQNRTINRYQNNTSPLENMTLGTAKKIYDYYKIKVVKTMYKNISTGVVLNGEEYLEMVKREVKEKLQKEEYKDYTFNELFEEMQMNDNDFMILEEDL